MTPTELRQFADSGHRFEVLAECGSFSLSVTGSGPGPLAIDTDGRWDDAFDEEKVAAAESADAETLLGMCAGMDGQLTLTVIHPADTAACHWLRTTGALTRILDAADWPASLRRLLAGPPLTIVGDAGQATVRCGRIVFAGPTAEPVAPAGDIDAASADRHEATLPKSDPRRGLPRPSQIAPIDAAGLEDLAALLTGAAASLTWLWLGNTVQLEEGLPRVRFEGALPLNVDLPPARMENASAELSLWQWSIRGDDTTRRDAVQQAVALIVRDAAALAQSAPRVLSVARFLHQASQRGLLTEALATRRAARDAAVATARTSAETARSVARSTFDRVLVQIAAAAGLLLAAKGGLLDKGVALALALTVAALLAGTAANAFLSDYKSANSALAAFSTDLRIYGDALTPEDIAEVQQMSVLADARAAIKRARTGTTWTLIVSGIVGVVLLALTIASSNDSTTPPDKNTTTSTFAGTSTSTEPSQDPAGTTVTNGRP